MAVTQVHTREIWFISQLFGALVGARWCPAGLVLENRLQEAITLNLGCHIELGPSHRTADGILCVTGASVLRANR